MHNKNNLILLVLVVIIAAIGVYWFLGNLDGADRTSGEIRVACYNGEGVMEDDLVILPNLVKWMGYEYSEVSGRDIKRGVLRNFDVLILPGGNGPLYWNDLGKQGKEAIQDFVYQGGGYFGICEGAYRAFEYAVWIDAPENLVLNNPDSFLGLISAVAWGPVFEVAERPDPGWGMAAIDIVDNIHPITDSHPERFTMYYLGGCYLVPSNEGEFTILGVYNATGEPAIASCDYWQGRVFITGPHPEFEEDDDRDGIKFYEPIDGSWDPESDWPLLRDAVMWLCKIEDS